MFGAILAILIGALQTAGVPREVIVQDVFNNKRDPLRSCEGLKDGYPKFSRN
jgi:hypothetical protein